MASLCMRQVDAAYEIESMLLMSFVENAFKHDTWLAERAEITIDLKAEHGILNFLVRNRFSPDAVESKDAASGIGLPGMQRRLDLT
jgi:two-component system, LytTR family, sensor kinase